MTDKRIQPESRRKAKKSSIEGVSSSIIPKGESETVALKHWLCGNEFESDSH
jgi:hypothetical protein